MNCVIFTLQCGTSTTNYDVVKKNSYMYKVQE